MTMTEAQMYERMGRSERKAGDPRSDVEVDRDRIVHSHAFRRLQRKTQIVGVRTVDFFRTRLTHTIECAQLGRALCQRLTDDAWQTVVTRREHLPDLVEAACLAHDLGHPPFGHTGEEALDALLADRYGMRFEGNAQSFRIVTLLEPKKYHRLTSPLRRPLGLDLTRATLQAMSKYPWTESHAQRAGLQKFGVYDSSDDLEYHEWLWSGSDAPHARTLATDIMEAADDLAYAVHDIEDGIWARLVPVDQIVQGEAWAIERITRMAMRRNPGMFDTDPSAVEREIRDVFGVLSSHAWATKPFDRSRSAEGGLKSFCSALTNELVEDVTDGGSLRWRDNEPLQRRIAVLKAVIWVWLVEQPELITRRHGQRRVIRQLFDGYLADPRMLPYQDEWARVADRGEREQVRFVCDHLASMTDAYAAHVHAEMHGMSTGFGWE